MDILHGAHVELATDISHVLLAQITQFFSQIRLSHSQNNLAEVILGFEQVEHEKRLLKNVHFP